MHGFIFGIYPYIALSVLLIGSVARYERDPFTWKSSSSQLLRRRQLILGSVLFHIGVLTIFVGHFFGLLTPLSLLSALHITHEAKQILAIVVGGAGAIAALIGGFMLLHRRLFDPRIRATSSTMSTVSSGASATWKSSDRPLHGVSTPSPFTNADRSPPNACRENRSTAPSRYSTKRPV